MQSNVYLKNTVIFAQYENELQRCMFQKSLLSSLKTSKCCFKFWLIFRFIWHVHAIQDMQDTVFHWDIQTLGRDLEIGREPEYFRWHSRCPDSLWNTDSRVGYIFLIYLPYRNKLRSKRSQNLKSRYTDLLHGYDFFCFTAWCRAQHTSVIDFRQDAMSAGDPSPIII